MFVLPGNLNLAGLWYDLSATNKFNSVVSFSNQFQRQSSFIGYFFSCSGLRSPVVVRFLSYLYAI